MEQNKNYPPTFFLSIFPVKEKKNEKSPDFRISAKVGNEYVNAGSAWKKQSDKGMYLSLSIDCDIAKKLIIEKMNSLTSAGNPVPFTPDPTDPFEL